MASPPSLEAVLAGVSIRGRMAFASDCIRRWVATTGVSSDALQLALDLMSTFCSAEDLGDWEFNLLSSSLSASAARPIADQTGDDALGQAIEAALQDIGRSNLYAAVDGHSEQTLQGALRIARLTRAPGVELPDPQRYETWPFWDAHGWGEPREIDD